MARMKEEIRDYESAVRYLRGKEARTIGHNTSIVTSWGPPHPCGKQAIGVLYHSTVVLWWHPDGTLELWTGGWETSTTKQRLNAFLPNPYRVYAKNGDWRLWDFENGLDYTFHDGMRVYPEACHAE